MKKNQKCKRSTLIALLLVAGLTACGGGGGGGGEPNSIYVPAVSTPAPVIDNVFKNLYDAGVYTLEGYGFILNGVVQITIGKDTIDSNYKLLRTTPVYGATITGSALSDLFPQIYTFDATNQINFVFGSDKNSAELVVTGNAPTAKWKATLTETDVTGQLVANYIKRDPDALVNDTFAKPGQVFSAGAKSYVTTLEASMDMLFQYDSQAFISTESQLTTSYGCRSVVGVTPMLLTELQANGTIKFYETTAGSCTRTGEVLIASDGAWTKRTVGPDTFYDISYPASVTVGKFSELFTNATGPSNKAVNVYINKPTGSTKFYAAQLVRQGEKFVSRQPHFNAGALNDLRALSGV